jgi:hypothetical protein
MIMTNRPHRLHGPLGIGSTSVGAPPGSVPCRAACVARDKSPLSRSFSCGRLVSFVQRICAVDAEADGAVERRQQRGFLLLTQSRNGDAGPTLPATRGSFAPPSRSPAPAFRPRRLFFTPREAWLRVRCHLRCFLCCDQPTNRRRWPEGGPTGGHVLVWVRGKGLLPVPGEWSLPDILVVATIPGGWPFRYTVTNSGSPACEFELVYGNRRSNSNPASPFVTERAALPDTKFEIWSLKPD